MIYLRDPSQESQWALRRLCESSNWPDYESLGSPETLAWVWFRLREMKDTEDLFPKGKWATLQRIQEILEREAKEANDGQHT